MLGLTVTDDDDAVVSVVAPITEKNPKTPKPTTAFTGFDDRGLTGFAIALMVLGLAAVLFGRRRRGLQA